MRRDFVLAALLVGSLAANAYQHIRLSDVLDQKPYLGSLDQPFIERSVADYTARHSALSGGRSEEAMANRFPVVARTADGLCVNLMLKQGSIGTTPVYCYSGDGRLTYRGEV